MRVLAGIAFAAALICPALAAPAAPVVPPVQYWDLPTGSHIAYRHYAAPQKNAVPVIFIHGGPGAHEVKGSPMGIAWFSRLNEQGFDVWYYDQIGGGLSARLADPRQYTVKRHVADLDAIRGKIGADRFIGVGESWGAILLANYMAAHPGIVLRAAFVSPGWIDPSQIADPSEPPQLDEEFIGWIGQKYPDRLRRYRELDRLMRRDVVAAHRDFPDGEMDPLLDEYINTVIRDRTVHDPVKAPRHDMAGMGWWSCVMTGWDAISHSAAPQKKLASDHTPVLVMRPQSDYIPMESARGYLRTFPQAKFVEVPKAGHMIYLEQPGIYTSTLEAFFAAK